MKPPLGQIAISGPTKAPAYTHAVRGLLFAHVRLKGGRFLSAPLDTSNTVVAVARMVPLLERLIRAGKLDRRARVCRLYLPGRCASCGRPFPGAK
jgi:hypothetical protein